MEKISLKKCRSLLENGGVRYTDEEIISIRDYLYSLAEIDYSVFKSQEEREAKFAKQPNNKAEIQDKLDIGL